MKNIKINDTIYSIPTSWDDISINKWNELSMIKDYLKPDMTDSEKFDFNLVLISILTGIPEDILLSIPGEYYKKIFDLIDFYFIEPLSTELTNSFSVLGIEYKLMDLTKLTFGDRANIDILRDSGNFETKIGRVIAILYRAEGEGELTSEELNDKEAIFNEHLSINSVYQTIIFFLSLAKIYTQNTQFYSIVKEREQLLMTLPRMTRMKMRMKSAVQNIIIIWRLGLLKGKYWKLKKFSR